MSKIIPNTFQTPNAHVDLAMRFLTGEQYKVLNFAVRHVYGWQDRPERYEGRIALSVFFDGFTTESGDRYYGCGLSRNTIVDILGQLVKFGLLTKMGEPTEDGQRWSIGKSPKWDLIAAEYTKRESVNAARAQKMNEARERKRRAQVSSHDTISSDEQKGVSCDDTTLHSSDDTHIKPCENQAENHDYASDDAVAHINATSRHTSIADEVAPVPFTGDNTNAPAPTRTKGKTKAQDTTPPSKVALKVSPTRKEQDTALVVALGDAWGIPAASSDWGLYVKKARELVKDIPVEKFKMFFDWRKKEAGDFAEKLTIANITGNGYVSKFLQWDATEGEKERKRQAQAAKVYAQYPQIDPANQPNPSEYIQGAEKEAYFARIAQFTQGKHS
jgi:hypothetical protein